MFAEFFSQNVIWFAALAVLCVLIVMSFIQSQVSGAKMVSALEMPQLQRDGESVIIDCNSEKEFALSHIPNSENYPVDSIDQNNKSLLKHKDKTVIVVCQSGNKSIKAAKSLVGLDFTNVHVLRGGLLNWTKENLPVTAS